MRQTIEGLLSEGHNVKALSVSTKKHPFKPTDEDKEILNKTSFEHIFIDTDVKPTSAFFYLFKKSSYNIQRFYSKEFEARLVQILKEKKFDIIQFESLFMFPYLEICKRLTDAKCVLRAHNVESKLWKRRAQESSGAEKIYLSHLQKKLMAAERQASHRFDAVVTISREDEKVFFAWGAKQIAVVPFGVEKEVLSFNQNNTLSFFFIGAMDWEPNREGLEWFVENVWPAFHLEFRNIKFHIAGRKMDRKIQADNIVNHGEVSSSKDFMKQHTILVAPYFSGGGMRVKIAQALSLGKPVVTTTIGAEGLTECVNKGIYIADTAQTFLQVMKKMVLDDTFRNQAGKQGYENVQKFYGADASVKKLVTFYSKVVN